MQDGKLHCRAPAGVIDQGTMAYLRDCKAELLAMLTKEGSDPPGPVVSVATTSKADPELITPPGWPEDVPLPDWWEDFLRDFGVPVFRGEVRECPRCGFPVRVFWQAKSNPNTTLWTCPSCWQKNKYSKPVRLSCDPCGSRDLESSPRDQGGVNIRCQDCGRLTAWGDWHLGDNTGKVVTPPPGDRSAGRKLLDALWDAGYSIELAESASGGWFLLPIGNPPLPDGQMVELFALYDKLHDQARDCLLQALAGANMTPHDWNALVRANCRGEAELAAEPAPAAEAEGAVTDASNARAAAGPWRTPRWRTGS